MRTLIALPMAALLAALALSGCQDTVAPVIDDRPPPPEDGSIAEHRIHGFGEWSAPVELGAPINLPDADTRTAFRTRDGLHLFFASIREGGLGGRDLYVSQRATERAPWGEPTNLGAPINVGIEDVHGDNHPNLSPGGHWLFFSSIRPGGCGGRDTYASHRNDVHDDLGWEPPINLGCTINSENDDITPVFFRDPRTGRAQLFFATERTDGLGADDFYVSTRQRDGSWGAGALVAGLSSAYEDNKMTIRADGLEAFFSSSRPTTPGGEEGDYNIWTATRRSLSAPWSTPTLVIEGYGLPSLSWDAQTLYLVGGMAANPDLAGVFAATRTAPWDHGMELAARRANTQDDSDN